MGGALAKKPAPPPEKKENPWKRRIGMIFALSAGIANVSSQFSLVINSLIYPPVGYYLLYQNATASDPVNILHVDTNKAMNTSYGLLPLPPLAGHEYLISKGEPNTTFTGGQIIYHWNNSLWPFAMTTPQNMLYVCPPQDPNATAATPLNVQCTSALEAAQLALVILSFIREAAVIGLFVYWCTKKQQWFRQLSGVVDSAAMGVLWYTACLTQKKYREALDQKKLPPVEKFERVGNFTDLGTTIVSMIVASTTVHYFAVAGAEPPGVYTAQLVTGSLGFSTLLGQFVLFLKDECKKRKGGDKAAEQQKPEKKKYFGFSV